MMRVAPQGPGTAGGGGLCGDSGASTGSLHRSGSHPIRLLQGAATPDVSTHKKAANMSF